MKGDKVRYEREILSFVNSDKGQPLQMVTAFDGELNQSFLPTEGKSGSGTIGEAKVSDDVAALPIQAVTVAFRPLTVERATLYPPGSGLKPRYRLSQPSLRIDGREVVAFEASIGEGDPSFSGSLKRTVFVDPRQSFLPLRCTEEVDGILVVQVDVEYEQDDRAGWVPATWNASWFNRKGQITQAEKGRVTEYSINEELPDDLFRIKYPVGAVITDMRRGERELVMAPDGTLKPVVLIDSALPHRNWWIMIGVTSVIVVVLFWYCYKQRSAATST